MELFFFLIIVIISEMSVHENIYSSAIDGEGGVSQGRKTNKHGHVFVFFLQLWWNVVQNKVIVTLN